MHGWKLQRAISSEKCWFRELARLLRHSPRRSDHTNESTTQHAAFGSGAAGLLLPDSGTLSQNRRYRPQSTSYTLSQSSQPQCLSPATPQCVSPACGTSGPRGAPHIRLYFSSRPRLQNVRKNISLYNALHFRHSFADTRRPHCCRPSRLAVVCQAQQQRASFGSIAAAALAATSLLAGVRMERGCRKRGGSGTGRPRILSALLPVNSPPLTMALSVGILRSLSAAQSSPTHCRSPQYTSPSPPAVRPSSELQRTARADVPSGEQGYGVWGRILGGGRQTLRRIIRA